MYKKVAVWFRIVVVAFVNHKMIELSMLDYLEFWYVGGGSFQNSNFWYKNKVILVNVLGGIIKYDIIATRIVAATK